MNQMYQNQIDTAIPVYSDLSNAYNYNTARYMEDQQSQSQQQQYQQQNEYSQQNYSHKPTLQQFQTLISQNSGNFQQTQNQEYDDNNEYNSYYHMLPKYENNLFTVQPATQNYSTFPIHYYNPPASHDIQRTTLQTKNFKNKSNSANHKKSNKEKQRQALRSMPPSLEFSRKPR